jgi:hypothetical protein
VTEINPTAFYCIECVINIGKTEKGRSTMKHEFVEAVGEMNRIFYPSMNVFAKLASTVLL